MFYKRFLLEYLISVFVSATVSALISIKELEGIWQSKVQFEMTWYDQRLFMQNLKDNDNLNILRRKKDKRSGFLRLSLLIMINQKEWFWVRIHC